MRSDRSRYWRDVSESQFQIMIPATDGDWCGPEALSEQYLSESTWSIRRSSERAPVQRCKDESHYVKNISGSDNCVAVLFYYAMNV